MRHFVWTTCWEKSKYCNSADKQVCPCWGKKKVIKMLPNTQLVSVLFIFFIFHFYPIEQKQMLHLDYCQLLVQLAGCSQMNPAWPLGFMWRFISWAVLAERKPELILIILLNIRLMIIINQYRHLHNSPVKKKMKEISECQKVWFRRFDLRVKWLNEMEHPVRVRRPT